MRRNGRPDNKLRLLIGQLIRFIVKTLTLIFFGSIIDGTLYFLLSLAGITLSLPVHLVIDLCTLGLLINIFFDVNVLRPVINIFSRIRRKKNPPAETNDPNFGAFPVLNLGSSTGHLRSLSHGSGISPGQDIALGMEDASQNILVLGGIGSGKTTRVMHSLLFQLLKAGHGGLIFDIKGDFIKATEILAENAGRGDIIVFGPGHNQMNLLAGLSPEISASFLKSAFLLSGSRADGFWMDTATELCRNALGVLSFLPQHYSLEGLYSYLFDEDKREEFDASVRDLLPELDERNTRLLRSYLNYHESVFSRFDEKVVSGVYATVAQVLSPFSHPDLIDAFCTQPPPQDGHEMLQMEDVLLPFVIFIDLPLSVWGMGAKVVYTFIKLRFFNVMQRRYDTDYEY